MNEQTKNLIIVVCGYLFLGLIIAILTGFCINFNNKLSMVTDDKTELIESNRISIELVDSLEQKLRDRDARIKRNKRTIDTLQSNLRTARENNRESEKNIRESEENKRRLDEANRRLAEYERREQDRKSERNRIITEIENGIKKLKEDIEKIPTEAMD